MRRLLFLLCFLPSLALAQSISDIAGKRALSEAKALWGEPSTLGDLRSRFAAPKDTGFASVEVFSRRGQPLVDIVTGFYATPQDLAKTKKTLKLAATDLSYNTLSGEARELFLAPRCLLHKDKDGKVLAVSWLSQTALEVIVSDIARSSFDATSPDAATRSLLFSLLRNNPSELSGKTALSEEDRKLLFQQRSLLLRLAKNLTVVVAKNKKEATVTLSEPLLGSANLLYKEENGAWFLQKAALTTEGDSAYNAFVAWKNSLLVAAQVPTDPYLASLPMGWSRFLSEGQVEEAYTSTTEESILLYRLGDTHAKVLMKKEGKQWMVSKILSDERF